MVRDGRHTVAHTPAVASGRRAAAWSHSTFGRLCAWSATDARRAWLTVGAATVAAAAALTVAATAFSSGRSPLDLQGARTAERLRILLRDHGDELGRHLAADAAFLVLLTAAVVLVTAACVASRGEHGRRLRPWTWVVLVVPVAADAAENLLLLVAERDDRYGLAPAIHSVATLKWIGYAALAAAVLVLLAQRLRYDVTTPPPETRRAGPPCEIPGVARAADGASVGIALSGGGIRSAAFGLGGLGGLGNDRVRGARYLSAASGGAYIAAAMTMQAHREFAASQHAGELPDESRLPFGDGSPELDRLRARSSFLALNGAEGRVGVFQAMSRIAFNLLVLWLVVFAVGRPVGWLLSTEGLHPELLAREPLVQAAALDADVEDDDLEVRAAGSAPCGDRSGPRFLVTVAGRAISTDVGASRTSGEVAEATLPVTFTPAEVRACDGEVTVTAQPRAAVDASSIAGGSDERPLVEVTRQLAIRLDDDGLVGGGDGVPSEEEQLVERLRVEHQPVLVQQTGFRGRPNITIDWWMVVLPLGALAVAMVWSAVLQRRSTLQLSALPKALTTVAYVGLGLLVVLPWLLQELPTAADRLFDLLPGAPETVPGAPKGFLAWAAALLAAGQAVRATLTRAKPGRSRAGRSSLLVAKVVAMALTAAAGTAAVVAVVQQGALNGTDGRLAGFGAYWWGPGVRDVPDIARWLVVLAVLAVLAVTRSAHHWSFLPLYRDRLAAAFSLTDEPISGTAADQASITDCRTHEVPEAFRARWPELVICAAVNLNDPGLEHRVPAGRWADSFTFSPTEIGGPSVGYVPTLQYQRTLSEGRRRDLTLPSLVGISGAAFSPAMGKMAYGPIGGLFALLNLRLGVWLPHPEWVRSTGGEGTWKRRPGWPYLLRELFGRFRRHRPFVYVTDGGHWENLGLVELVRRRCDEIYVISAAGDGDRSFATIAEAIALAREQCGVDIHVDLSPLRPPVADPPKPPARQLLRRGKDGAPAPQAVAPSTHAVGWFRRDDGTRGRILFVEANLTGDMPWDVQAYAETSAVFPDDPTSDQQFDHRQFEAYRRLGQHQLERGVASPEWAAALAWVQGSLDDDALRTAIAAP